LTSTESDLRTALVAAINATGLDLGSVHAFERYLPSWEEWLDEFSSEIDSVTQVRGWEVMGPTIPTSEWFTFGRVVKRVYEFNLYGHLGLNDADETAVTMADLTDQLIDKLDGVALTTTNTYIYGPIVGPCTLPETARTEFGNVLCEHVRMVVPIEVVVDVQ
jgi:hypothetical protein